MRRDGVMAGRRRAERAKSRLAVLPPSIAKDALISLADKVVQRRG